jgi:outer membrane lipoprotein-sorting protein
MKHLSTPSLAIALAILLLAVSARAEEETTPAALTAKQIVEKANHVAYYAGQSGRATVSMTIVDAQKRKRSRAFTILRKDVEDTAEKQVDGEQRFYVYFRNPPDLNRMVFMVHKHPGKDDNRWLYLPDLDLVKRISAADKRTSFAGSHFLYEDVSGRHVAADKHVLESTTDAYYILKSTPKDPKTVEFASSKIWVHRKSFVVVQASTYDAEGKELRRYSALKVKKLQGHPTVVQSRMTDMRDKSYTVMTYSGVKYDLKMPDDVFTERYLRKPPAKYLD